MIFLVAGSRCYSLAVVRGFLIAVTALVAEHGLKTIARYHLPLVRMVTVKKSTNNKFWRGCEEKETPMHSWWLPRCLSDKESACNAGSASSIPSLGRFAGGGHGNAL